MQKFFRGLGTNNEQWSGVMTQYCQDISYQAEYCPVNNTHHVGYPTGGALAGVWVDNGGPFQDGSNLWLMGDEAGVAAQHFGGPALNPNGNIFLLLTPTGTWPNMGKSSFCATHLWNGSVDPLAFGQSGNSFGPAVAYGIIPY